MVEMVREKIAEQGWQVVLSPDRSVAFTVGLTERGWPELLTRNPAAPGAGELAGELVTRVAMTFESRHEQPILGVQIGITSEDGRRTAGLVLYPFPDPRSLDVLAALYADVDYVVLEICPDPLVPPTGV